MKNEIIVSIICCTYNNEKYIASAIDSFLMQKTDFKFEILIHDDASTDKSQEIITEYSKKYENIIPILRNENIYSKTKIYPLSSMYKLSRGKYFADCEGDDYWTDEYKLQKQVDFMEKNPQYPMCHHDFNILNCRNGTTTLYKSTDYSQNDLIFIDNRKHNNLHPSTRMRRNYYKGNEKAFDVLTADISILILMGMFGCSKYLGNIKPSVYRQYSSVDSWSNLSRTEKLKDVAFTKKLINDTIIEQNNSEWLKLRGIK